MPVFVDSSRCMQENSDGEVETREGSAATERCLLEIAARLLVVFPFVLW